jgi:hypothetical protein
MAITFLGVGTAGYQPAAPSVQGGLGAQDFSLLWLKVGQASVSGWTKLTGDASNRFHYRRGTYTAPAVYGVISSWRGVETTDVQANLVLVGTPATSSSKVIYAPTAPAITVAWSDSVVLYAALGSIYSDSSDGTVDLYDPASGPTTETAFSVKYSDNGDETAFLLAYGVEAASGTYGPSTGGTVGYGATDMYSVNWSTQLIALAAGGGGGGGTTITESALSDTAVGSNTVSETLQRNIEHPDDAATASDAQVSKQASINAPQDTAWGIDTVTDRNTMAVDEHPDDAATAKDVAALRSGSYVPPVAVETEYLDQAIPTSFLFNRTNAKVSYIHGSVYLAPYVFGFNRDYPLDHTAVRVKVNPTVDTNYVPFSPCDPLNGTTRLMFMADAKVCDGKIFVAGRTSLAVDDGTPYTSGEYTYLIVSIDPETLAATEVGRFHHSSLTAYIGDFYNESHIQTLEVDDTHVYCTVRGCIFKVSRADGTYTVTLQLHTSDPLWPDTSFPVGSWGGLSVSATHNNLNGVHGSASDADYLYYSENHNGRGYQCTYKYRKSDMRIVFASVSGSATDDACLTDDYFVSSPEGGLPYAVGTGGNNGQGQTSDPLGTQAPAPLAPFGGEAGLFAMSRSTGQVRCLGSLDQDMDDFLANTSGGTPVIKSYGVLQYKGYLADMKFGKLGNAPTSWRHLYVIRADRQSIDSWPLFNESNVSWARGSYGGVLPHAWRQRLVRRVCRFPSFPSGHGEINEFVLDDNKVDCYAFTWATPAGFLHLPGVIPTDTWERTLNDTAAASDTVIDGLVTKTSGADSTGAAEVAAGLPVINAPDSTTASDVSLVTRLFGAADSTAGADGASLGHGTALSDVSQALEEMLVKLWLGTLDSSSGLEQALSVQFVSVSDLTGQTDITAGATPASGQDATEVADWASGVVLVLADDATFGSDSTCLVVAVRGTGDANYSTDGASGSAFTATFVRVDDFTGDADLSRLISRVLQNDATGAAEAQLVGALARVIDWTAGADLAVVSGIDWRLAVPRPVHLTKQHSPLVRGRPAPRPPPAAGRHHPTKPRPR